MDDPERATVECIVAEVMAKSPEQRGHGAASGASALQLTAATAAAARWVAPAYSSIRMRLFCLPYAGGVSENVFARCARRTSSHAICGLPRRATPASSFL